MYRKHNFMFCNGVAHFNFDTFLGCGQTTRRGKSHLKMLGRASLKTHLGQKGKGPLLLSAGLRSLKSDLKMRGKEGKGRNIETCALINVIARA